MNTVAFFGLAFDCIMVTFEQNVRILGTTCGNASAVLPMSADLGDTERASCTGGMKSARSVSPLHGLIVNDLLFDPSFGWYLGNKGSLLGLDTAGGTSMLSAKLTLRCQSSGERKTEMPQEEVATFSHFSSKAMLGLS